MQLIFACPRTGRSFHSENYHVVESRGLRIDEQGRKVLDAKVALIEACPFCGQLHVYRADELACPFGI